MLLQLITSGLALGCIYSLVALGFILIFKSTDVLNFAQGELMLVGAFLAYTFIVYLNMPFWLAFILTIICSAVFGMLLERVFMRPLLGQPILALVMVTLGMGIIIRNAAGMIWTHETLSFPPVFSEEPLRFWGAVISPIHIWVIVITGLLVLVLALFFKFTRVGIATRASGLNQLATIYMGIDLERIFSLTWAMGAVVAGIAGILLAPLVFLDTNMGHIGLNAFPAAVLGGFGSIPGAIVGGLIIGVSESFAGVYLPPGFKETFAHIVLIAVLLIKPTGIFGEKETRKRV